MPSDHIRLYMPPSPEPSIYCTTSFKNKTSHADTPRLFPPTGGGSDWSTVHRHTEPHQRARAWEAESVQWTAIEVRTLRSASSDLFLFGALLYCMIWLNIWWWRSICQNLIWCCLIKCNSVGYNSIFWIWFDVINYSPFDFYFDDISFYFVI